MNNFKLFKYYKIDIEFVYIENFINFKNYYIS